MYNEKIIGLIEKYNTTDDKKEKAKIGVSLNRALGMSCHFEEGLKYAFEALKLIGETDSTDLILDCLSGIAVNYFNQSKFEQALKYFEQGLEYYNKYPQKGYLTSIYRNIGACYYNMYDNYKAVEYYLLANDALDENVPVGVVESLFSALGVIYTDIGDYKKSEEWHTKALKLENAENQYNTYYNLGYLHKRKKNHLLAIRYYKKSLELTPDKEDFEHFSKLHVYIAELYETLGKKDEAIENGNLALEYAIKSQIVEEIVEAYICLATIHTNMHDFKKGKEYFKLCLAREKEANNDEISERLFHKYSQFCFYLKNAKDGHFYKKKYLELKEKREKEAMERKIEFVKNIKS